MFAFVPICLKQYSMVFGPSQFARSEAQAAPICSYTQYLVVFGPWESAGAVFWEAQAGKSWPRASAQAPGPRGQALGPKAQGQVCIKLPISRTCGCMLNIHGLQRPPKAAHPNQGNVPTPQLTSTPTQGKASQPLASGSLIPQRISPK